MAYLVSSRKWRPQQFSELIGQSHIVQSFTNALTKEQIGHSYLFSGPRGVGKTSASRILAKSLNCETGITPSPCGKCSSCKEIENGIFVDVLEIDGASNRGIDEIRELRENVKYTPAKGRYKVYIIDEVHMLTDAAFNAILKTLEEPPDHVIFVLATTEAHKVKITIRSRCQHFHFRRLTLNDIKEQLQKILDEQGILYEEEALFVIAKAADGSMRDSQSLLEQAIAYCGEKITEGDVLTILGVPSEKIFIELIEFLIRKDLAALINLVSVVVDRGYDISEFVFSVTEYFRALLLLKTSNSRLTHVLSMTESSIDKMKDFINSFTSYQLLRLSQILLDLNRELKYTNHTMYAIQSALIQMIDYENFISAIEMLHRLGNLEASIKNSSPQLKSQPIKKPSQAQTPLSETNQKLTPPKVDSHSQSKRVDVSEIPKTTVSTKDIFLKNHWKELIDYLHDRKEIAFASQLLSCTHELKEDKQELLIEFENKSKHDLFLSNKKQITLVKDFFKEFLQMNVAVIASYKEIDQNKINENIEKIKTLFDAEIIE